MSAENAEEIPLLATIAVEDGRFEGVSAHKIVAIRGVGVVECVGLTEFPDGLPEEMLDFVDPVGTSDGQRGPVTAIFIEGLPKDCTLDDLKKWADIDKET